MTQKIAFLFPGQGDQYCGMGKEFYDNFATARRVFEEAEDHLQQKLTALVFGEAEDVLRQTKNSQLAIYVTSMALLRVLQEQYPELQPQVCGGLSLGEYTALTAAGKISFLDCLTLVRLRGQLMHDACEAAEGTMAAVIGLDEASVEEVVCKVALPQDLWAANFNSPGQTVLSGTPKGIEIATRVAKELGAKRVMPLNVHGAFHSGLMQSAEDGMTMPVHQVPLQNTGIQLVMNVTGTVVEEESEIRRNLIRQITQPVRWTQSIRTMEDLGVEQYIKIGCGKSLLGLNKRIGVRGQTVNIEFVNDLDALGVATV